jgi:hypothetical protein
MREPSSPHDRCLRELTPQNAAKRNAVDGRSANPVTIDRAKYRPALRSATILMVRKGAAAANLL